MFFVLFAAFLVAIAGLTYSGAGWCLPAGVAGRVQRGIIWFNALLVVLLPTGRMLYGLLGEELSRWGMLILTPLFMLEIFFGVGVLLVRSLGWPAWVLHRLKGQRPHPVTEIADVSRRRFLFGTALATTSLAASAYGTAGERGEVVVNRYEIPCKSLPAELEGFTIAQLSDVHLGMFYSLTDWRNLLERSAALGADALAVTGDVFDDDALNERAAVILDEFTDSFPQGIYFCYGNHEHFRNISRTRAALAKTKVKVLVNEGVCVAGERTEHPLWLVGVDYPMPRQRFDALRGCYVAEAYKQVPADAVTVLLAHHPDFIDDGAAQASSLVLTGHTHGGQLGALGVPLVPPIFKYMRGLYRLGDTFGYVHSGNGSWFPFRLGCPPEIGVFKLTR